MVGVCGVVGGEPHAIDGMAEHLAWTGEERVSQYDGPHLRLRGFTHDSRRGDQPGQAPDSGALVWVWGNVVGSHRDGRHRSRVPDDETIPAYCARLYDEEGLDFVRRLNGDFVGVVYDRKRSTVSVFTDRLGTWPLYQTETDDGSVVFSSRIQSLESYAPVSLAFEEEYVVHHLSWRGGPYGVKTPFRGVESFPPGTVTTYDVEDGSTTQERYWQPSVPTAGEFDEYSAFVDAFVDRFRSSVADRTRDESKRYGILLSGGSDARLILGALDDDVDVVAYHMAGWMSKEARIAEQVAISNDVEFRLLRRDSEYFGRVLDRSPEMWNFQQLFNQAWAEGFIDEIRDEVDVLLTGHFSDTLFKGTFVPTKNLDLGPLGTYDTGTELPVTSVEEFYRELGPRKAPYVDSEVNLLASLGRNITRTEDGVESYGIEFDSFREFVLGRLHAPATTDPLFRQSLRESIELQMPVFDTRLLDLWERMPIRYRTRRNVINSAVARIAPELGDIPHAHSGLPVRYPELLHRFGAKPMNALGLLSPFDSVPAEHLSHHPWGNQTELLRRESYVWDAIADSEDVVRSLPFLDWEAVVTCYEDHLAGDNNTKLLHRLVTFLRAPVTRRIALSGAEDRVVSSNERSRSTPGGRRNRSTEPSRDDAHE